MLSVDLIAGRMKQLTFRPVPLQTLDTLHILQTVLADVHDGTIGELLGIGREVPGLDEMQAEKYGLNVFDASDHVLVGCGHHAAGDARATRGSCCHRHHALLGLG